MTGFSYSQVAELVDALLKEGRESSGSTPIDEMVSLVTGSNPVLTTKLKIMKNYWTQIILFYLTMFITGFLIVRFLL